MARRKKFQEAGQVEYKGNSVLILFDPNDDAKHFLANVGNETLYGNDYSEIHNKTLDRLSDLDNAVWYRCIEATLTTKPPFALGSSVGVIFNTDTFYYTFYSDGSLWRSIGSDERWIASEDRAAKEFKPFSGSTNYGSHNGVFSLPCLVVKSGEMVLYLPYDEDALNLLETFTQRLGNLRDLMVVLLSSADPVKSMTDLQFEDV